MSGLSSVHRYSMMKLGHPESVLEHIGFVVFIANLMSHEINLIKTGTVDIGIVTMKAIVHDIEELVVGDVPRPTKYHSAESREMFRKIEKLGVSRVVKELHLSESLGLTMESSHEMSKIGREGLIVSIADTLAVVSKVWEEVILRSNYSMVRQSFTVCKQLDRLDEKIKSMHFDNGVVSFLCNIVSDARRVMMQAQLNDRKIHGSMKEEMVD